MWKQHIRAARFWFSCGCEPSRGREGRPAGSLSADTTLPRVNRGSR